MLVDRAYDDDPEQLAELWDWLEADGWACDNGRAPDPAMFMREAHRWAPERERMIAERNAEAIEQGPRILARRSA